MEIQIHIAEVDKLNSAIKDFDLKVREAQKALGAVHAALVDLCIEISQPVNGSTD